MSDQPIQLPYDMVASSNSPTTSTALITRSPRIIQLAEKLQEVQRHHVEILGAQPQHWTRHRWVDAQGGMHEMVHMQAGVDNGQFAAYLQNLAQFCETGFQEHARAGTELQSAVTQLTNDVTTLVDAQIESIENDMQVREKFQSIDAIIEKIKSSVPRSLEDIRQHLKNEGIKAGFAKKLDLLCQSVAQCTTDFAKLAEHVKQLHEKHVEYVEKKLQQELAKQMSHAEEKLQQELAQQIKRVEERLEEKCQHEFETRMQNVAHMTLEMEQKLKQVDAQINFNAQLEIRMEEKLKNMEEKLRSVEESQKNSENKNVEMSLPDGLSNWNNMLEADESQLPFFTTLQAEIVGINLEIAEMRQFQEENYQQVLDAQQAGVEVQVEAVTNQCGTTANEYYNVGYGEIPPPPPIQYTQYPQYAHQHQAYVQQQFQHQAQQQYIMHQQNWQEEWRPNAQTPMCAVPMQDETPTMLLQNDSNDLAQHFFATSASPSKNHDQEISCGNPPSTPPTANQGSMHAVRGLFGTKQEGEVKDDLAALDPSTRKEVAKLLAAPKWNGSYETWHAFEMLWTNFLAHWKSKIPPHLLVLVLCVNLPEAKRDLYLGLHRKCNWDYTAIWKHLSTKGRGSQNPYSLIEEWRQVELPTDKSLDKYETWYHEWTLKAADCPQLTDFNLKEQWTRVVVKHGSYDEEIKKIFEKERLSGTSWNHRQLHQKMTELLTVDDDVDIVIARFRDNVKVNAVHAEKSADTTKIICHNCKKQGHYSSDCPQLKNKNAEVVCNHCNRKGHMVKDCWKKFPEKAPSNANRGRSQTRNEDNQRGRSQSKSGQHSNEKRKGGKGLNLDRFKKELTARWDAGQCVLCGSEDHRYMQCPKKTTQSKPQGQANNNSRSRSKTVRVTAADEASQPQSSTPAPPTH